MKNKIRLVEQNFDIDCGIAVAAMLSGYSYNIVKRLDAIIFPNCIGGLSVQQMEMILKKLTRCNVSTKRKAVKLNKSTPPVGALLIRQNKDVYGHWIASDGVNIFDPEKNSPIPIEQYERAEWDLIRVLSISEVAA